MLPHHPGYDTLSSELEREKYKLRKLSPDDKRYIFTNSWFLTEKARRENEKLFGRLHDSAQIWVTENSWNAVHGTRKADLHDSVTETVRPEPPLLRDPVKARQPSNAGQTVSRLIPRKNHFPTQFQTEATNKRQEPGLSRALTIDWKRREKLHAPGPSMDVPISASHDLKPASIGAVKPRATRPSRFLRGDVDQDGQVSIRDAEALLKWIYAIGPEPSCLKSADVNDDGEVGPDDALQLINYTAHARTPPATPFPLCGEDSEKIARGKDLGCNSYDACVQEEEEEEEENQDRAPSG